jgi:hypothetical protein
MNEDALNKYMMVGAMCLAGLSGLGTVALLIATAAEYSWIFLTTTVLLGAATVGFSFAASFYGSKIADDKQVFSNQVEREVLNAKQRKILKGERGEVVMERALAEIRNERENIAHREIEAAGDPEKPPHLTRWTTDGFDRRKIMKGYDDD